MVNTLKSYISETTSQIALCLKYVMDHAKAKLFSSLSKAIRGTSLKINGHIRKKIFYALYLPYHAQ